jgi:UDP-3-O-[3-hydroxymyristoyl] glucosamine N-acyltransferase
MIKLTYDNLYNFSIFAEMIFTALQIAEIIDGKLMVIHQLKLVNFQKLKMVKKGSLTFLSNPKYTPFIYSTNASVTIVNESLFLNKILLQL